MATYLVINLIVLGLLAAGVPLSRWRPSRYWLLAVVALLVLTAVFDNLIVGSGIVAYSHALILNLYVVKAPVEDFAYALGAMVIVPALWTDLERRR